MKPFLDVMEDPAPEIVDCGSCPVSMACAVGQGGNGFTFDCCRATAVEMPEATLIIDCQQHQFEQSALATECKLCPLCTGDIMVVALRDAAASTKNRYVPTVHAKVAIGDRVRLWKMVLPEHRQREEQI